MTDLIPPHLSAPVAAVDRTYACENCGCSPAAPMTFRGHRGMIILMSFLKNKGVYCRDCGLAVFRSMTSRTMIQGWWGWASFVITPFILLYNLFGRLKLNKMAAPVPSPDGWSGAPWPAGRPIYLRPTIVGALVPLAVLGLIVVGIATGGDSSKVGQCVRATAGGDVTFVDCSKSNDGVVTKVVESEDQCPSDSIATVEEYRESRYGGSKTTYDYLCIGATEQL
ncbi:hypothetical protein QEZ54_31185 [Catellatospora sp. KI3]|uniref:hypothetical protein n=1 Tax=Catellatospora sp. KI3 TaxID=3041620 RepID=UPI0024821142|nr:hypothetical protein [Catellatospora sp. KI3]MDI1465442.1 hypothetical protein [Catellatospora sp. KI3]